MNTQVENFQKQATPTARFNAFLQKHKAQMELALPKHLNADRMVRLSLTAFSQNKKLQECDPNSIFSSIIIASQLGLEIGVNGQGYLVPYKTTCTFIPGWKGLVDLANRGSRCVVWTGAVYEGDDFDYMLGDSPYCKHRPNGEFEESKLTHVYAIGRVKGSEMPVIEVWPVKKVHAHFHKNVVPALQSNHYAKKHFEAYAKKVALLQVLKYMPQSIELSTAIDVTAAAEQGKAVTIEGDFISVDNSDQNPDQDPNDHQVLEDPSQREEAYFPPTFTQIKHGILSVKSSAHLDVLEEQVMDHENKDERKKLMLLIKAQSEKFNASITAMEEVPVKKPDSDVKKTRTVKTKIDEPQTTTTTDSEYQALLTALIINASKARSVQEANIQVKYTQSWTEEQRKPLMEAINKRLVELKDQANSINVRINQAKTTDELNKLLPELRELNDHDVMIAYTQRKETLSQGDIFIEVDTEIGFVEGVVLRIQNATSQDDINAEYANPAIEELSDVDRQRIDLAAQQRETELQG